MRELPSPTRETICGRPLSRNPFVLRYSSAEERMGCGKVDVSKSSYGFTQEFTESRVKKCVVCITRAILPRIPRSPFAVSHH
jgi:hypothetical protein